MSLWLTKLAQRDCPGRNPTGVVTVVMFRNFIIALTVNFCNYKIEEVTILPEKWTGRLVGRMHNERVTYEDLGAEMGVTKAYVSMILNGTRKPEGIRERMEAAFDAVIAKRKEG